jgi:hypothetical protein
VLFPRAVDSWPLFRATTTGVTVYLGKFDGGADGLGLGFFLVAYGWSDTGRTMGGVQVGGVKENQSKDSVFYTLRALNPETGAGYLNQHAIMLKDSMQTGTDQRNYQRLVLGIEDLRREGGDHDFNDALMVIHASPTNASDAIGDVIENLGTLPQL